MSATITIRTDLALRRELTRRANAAGQTLSELVREILAAAVNAQPLQVRAGHLKARLRLPRRHPAWRERIRERNWR